MGTRSNPHRGHLAQIVIEILVIFISIVVSESEPGKIVDKKLSKD